jgi:hypothetical protein
MLWRLGHKFCVLFNTSEQPNQLSIWANIGGPPRKSEKCPPRNKETRKVVGALKGAPLRPRPSGMAPSTSTMEVPEGDSGQKGDSLSHSQKKK